MNFLSIKSIALAFSLSLALHIGALCSIASTEKQLSTQALSLKLSVVNTVRENNSQINNVREASDLQIKSEIIPQPAKENKAELSLQPPVSARHAKNKPFNDRKDKRLLENETVKLSQEVKAEIDPALKARYEDQLAAWLERQKYYPQQAKRRKIEGQALVEIAIDKLGSVVEFEVVKSSGSSILDRTLATMVRRANPFPPMPKEYSGVGLTFVVPVEFKIR